MSPTVLIIAYCVLIVMSSLLGGWLPSLIRLTHTRVELMMSGVGGLMLGIALFHLLPHAVGPQVSLDRAIWWLMIGLLTTFLLIRVFHAHEHAPAADSDEPSPESDGHEREHHHGHGHDGHGHHQRRGRRSKFSWVGIAVGLSMHTLLDGVALAAGVLQDHRHVPEMLLYGFAVFLGVVLHKPLDSLSITSLMKAAGWPFRTQQFVNFSYAMMCPLGATLFFVGVRNSPHADVLIGCALAFAAGIFICISLADLLPELQFHAHDRLKLTAALLVGVALAYGIRYLEPAHVHADSSQSDEQSHGHSHDAP